MRATFRVFGALFGKLFGFFIATSAVSTLLRLLSQSAAIANDSSDSLYVGLGTIAPVAVQVVLGSLATAIAAMVVADFVAGETPSVRESIRSARPLIREMFAAALLAALICLGVSVALVFTSLIFVTLFYGPLIVAQVISLEAMPLQRALGRSRDLARGQWLRVLPYLFCIALGVGLAGYFGLYPVFLALRGAPDGFQVLVFSAARVVLEALGGSLFAVAAAILYLDLRARKEDFGLQELRAERA